VQISHRQQVEPMGHQRALRDQAEEEPRVCSASVRHGLKVEVISPHRADVAVLRYYLSKTAMRYSDVTPKEIYLNRRRFLWSTMSAALALPIPAAAAKLAGSKTAFNAGGEKITPQKIATTYNNFYEFGTGKDEPAKNAPTWKPNSPWTVRIEGEVVQPKTLDIDQILKLAPLEERIYRHRCMEAGRS